MKKIFILLIILFCTPIFAVTIRCPDYAKIAQEFKGGDHNIKVDGLLWVPRAQNQKWDSFNKWAEFGLDGRNDSGRIIIICSAHPPTWNPTITTTVFYTVDKCKVNGNPISSSSYPGNSVMECEE